VQFGENRGLSVRLVVLLVSRARYLHQTGLLQTCELAMDRADTALHQPDQLGALEAAIRLTEEQA
jgi:hypothetical protein